VHSKEITDIINGNNLLEIEMMDSQGEKINKSLLKQERKKYFEQKFSIKGGIYKNCQILAPDGELLSYTHEEKIRWYLKRNMAELVSENPPTIKLNFEPSGRQISDLKDLDIDKFEFLKRSRKNECVICGKQESLLKYHVVPVLYRQHFPTEMKSHRSYDIVLLCFRCHEKANQEAEKYKQEIAKKYDVPLIEFNKTQYLKKAIENLKKCIESYEKNKDKMPKERIKYVKDNMIRAKYAEILQDESLPQELKEKFSQFETNKKGKVKIGKAFIDYFTNLNLEDVIGKTNKREFRNIHGKLIVEKFQTLDQLKSFVDDWRMFFIYSMNPQFLPHDWHLVLAKRKQNAELMNKSMS